MSVRSRDDHWISRLDAQLSNAGTETDALSVFRRSPAGAPEIPWAPDIPPSHFPDKFPSAEPVRSVAVLRRVPVVKNDPSRYCQSSQRVHR
jgi:hypothetical protein